MIDAGRRLRLRCQPRAATIRCTSRGWTLLFAVGVLLATAKAMAFTVVISYESPSRLGPPLLYTTKSDVTVQRPDKLRVITAADERHAGGAEPASQEKTVRRYASCKRLSSALWVF